MNESIKIPMWKKIAYGCGAAGGNVMSTLLASFLLSYYTDTAGIAAAAIGTMFIIARLLDGVTDLTFDLEKLDYISSAGLRVLLSAQKTMNKQGSMKIVNVSETIMEIFEVTGFLDILTVE